MINYIIQAAIYLGGCFAFYKLLLQKETFYKLNRYLLALCIVLSFTLPLLRVPAQFSFRKTEAVTVAAVNPIPTVAGDVSSLLPSKNNTPVIEESHGIDQWIKWAAYLYWTGVAIFGLNFLLQLCMILYRAYSHPAIKDGSVRIVELKGDKAPCSFANNVFINPEKYDWDTYSQVLIHEKIHVLQWHTLDILLAEITLVFQWFNPFERLYLREI
jgi:beta-lactamase regulating signal transducer with metallopeptidase domain